MDFLDPAKREKTGGPFLSMTPDLRVAIYCRLSEEDKHKICATEDSRSIQNQKSMLLQYAQEKNWKVYRIYSDEDYTGANRSRPAFQQLLRDAEQRCFDIILCKTQSRFTRELELVEKYIHGLFPLWGIRFVSIVDNADTANAGNKKSRQINGLVNEWYLEDLSQNIKSVLINRRKKGLHIGSFALYGYQKDPEQKGHLLIDPEAAKVVQSIFRLYAEGYGKTAIARLLNENGIPNPTEYKRLHGLRYHQPHSKNHTLWNYSSISKMLTNEIYIGNMVQGKYGSISYKTKQNLPRPKEQWYRVEGTHAPIIDPELWKQVQHLLSQKAKPFSSGTIGLFSGKVHCMYCGYAMRSNKQNDGRRYLMCSRRHLAKDACIGSFVSVSLLEQTVLSQLLALSQQYVKPSEVLSSVSPTKQTVQQKRELEASLVYYEKKITEYTKGVQNLYLDKVRGILSEEEYLDFSKEFTSQKKHFQELVQQTQNKLSALDTFSSSFANRQLLQKYLTPSSLHREMVDLFIRDIRIGKKDPLTQMVPVEIDWNF